MKKIAIVILNYNTYQDTINLLHNLCFQTFNDFSVIVVDNNSSNNSVEKIELFIEQTVLSFPIKIIKNEINGGYSYGNNIGMMYAFEEGFENILILNSDIVIPENNFLENLYNISTQTNAGIIGPKICQNNKLQKPLYEKRFSIEKEIIKNIFAPLDILLSKITRYTYKFEEKNVYGVSGCCFLINADICNSIGYFDEKVFLYGEELIISEKLYSRGIKVLFCPDLCVIHNHSQSIGSTYKQNKILEMQKKSILYYLKHYRNDIRKVLRESYRISFIIKKYTIIVLKKIR